MFRDMSGMAQTAALAQAALQASAQGATAVGEQAGQNMRTVMENNTERMRIAAQLAGQMMGAPATGGGAAPPGKGTVTERGGELNMAETIDAQNEAAGLSDGAVEDLNGSGDGTGAGIGGANGGGVDGPVVRPERRLRRLERTFEAQQDNPQAGTMGGVVREALSLARFDGAAAAAGAGAQVAQRGLARELRVIANFVQNIEFREFQRGDGTTTLTPIELVGPIRRWTNSSEGVRDRQPTHSLRAGKKIVEQIVSGKGGFQAGGNTLAGHWADVGRNRIPRLSARGGSARPA